MTVMTTLVHLNESFCAIPSANLFRGNGTLQLFPEKAFPYKLSMLPHANQIKVIVQNLMRDINQQRQQSEQEPSRWCYWLPTLLGGTAAAAMTWVQRPGRRDPVLGGLMGLMVGVWTLAMSQSYVPPSDAERWSAVQWAMAEGDLIDKANDELQAFGLQVQCTSCLVFYKI